MTAKGRPEQLLNKGAAQRIQLLINMDPRLRTGMCLVGQMGGIYILTSRPMKRIRFVVIKAQH